MMSISSILFTVYGKNMKCDLLRETYALRPVLLPCAVDLPWETYCSEAYTAPLHNMKCDLLWETYALGPVLLPCAI